MTLNTNPLEIESAQLNPGKIMIGNKQTIELAKTADFD
jgi:hypothetical protein